MWLRTELDMGLGAVIRAPGRVQGSRFRVANCIIEGRGSTRGPNTPLHTLTNPICAVWDCSRKPPCTSNDTYSLGCRPLHLLIRGAKRVNPKHQTLINPQNCPSPGRSQYSIPGVFFNLKQFHASADPSILHASSERLRIIYIYIYTHIHTYIYIYM